MAKGSAVIDIQRGQYTLWGIDGGPKGIRSDGNGLFVSEPAATPRCPRELLTGQFA